MMLLYETFLEKFSKTIKGITAKGVVDPIAQSGSRALQAAVQNGDKIIFTDGTMQMLIDKLAHPEQSFNEIEAALGSRDVRQIVQNAQSFRGAWIEFPKPIDKVAVMMSFIPSAYLPTGKDGLQLHLIGQGAEVVEVMEQPSLHGAWIYDQVFHRCTQCTRESGVLIPCERCRFMLTVWGNIFAFSAIIAAQYLAAMKYEEKTFTSIRRVARAKSSKERRVPVKHIFKVIDANEIIIRIPEQEEERIKEPRGSWIDSDTVYEEIHTRPFMRTYRHPRYVNVRGQTTTFPEGIKRLQPRKKENIGKQITKVKASLYESE